MEKRRVIAVAGTPGTGKTITASKLARRLRGKLVDLKKYAADNNIVSGFDEGRDTLVVDEKKMGKLLAKDLSKYDGDVVVEGLLSPFTPATHIVVLRCSPRELLQRLKARGYGKQKIRENLEAEVMGVCLYDSLWCKNVLEIDATDGVKVDEILAWLPKGGRKIVLKNWFPDYAHLLKDGF